MMLRKLTINNLGELRQEMKNCRVDPAGIEIMLEKGEFYVFKTSPLPSPGCNILKQQMLSIGGEVAVAKGAANCAINEESAIIIGTRKQLSQLVYSLDYQDFKLQELQRELKRLLQQEQAKYFQVGDRYYDLSQKTLVMGILNVTPDSFSDGGQFNTTETALKNAREMINAGADIIDIGGESTRPGAIKIDTNTELKRVIPVIRALQEETAVPISIDTYKSDVAAAALEAGATIVNDISGLKYDINMADVIAKYKASAVLMHIKGTPKSMQKNPVYSNMIDEIFEYLLFSADKLRSRGVEKSKIVLDPGIGFGKAWYKNYDLIRYLNEFKTAGFPLLVGPSRKSFIGNLLDLPVDQRLEGTLAAVSCSVMNGADIIRVHDVKENVRAVKVADKIVGKTGN